MQYLNLQRPAAGQYSHGLPIFRSVSWNATAPSDPSRERWANNRATLDPSSSLFAANGSGHS
jgi:hypothetical protein